MSELRVNTLRPNTGSTLTVSNDTNLTISGTGKVTTPTVEAADLDINGTTTLELKHNNVTKVAVTSGGATVTGTVTATAFSGDGSALTGVTSVGSGGNSSTGNLQLISNSGGANTNRDIIFLDQASEKARLYGATGNLAVDTDTLFVDATNDRVGIGKNNPTSTLDVDGTATATAFVGPLTTTGTVTAGTFSGPVDSLTFLASGTGATQRTALAKLRDVVSVKDFGAVGDGVTDDTAAIQAAITHASSQQVRLFFPNGKYKITSTLTTPNNGYVYLSGQSVACPAAGQDYTKFSTLYFAPTVDTVLLDLGTRNYFGFENMLFVSDDNTQTRTGINIGSLGGGTAQQNSQQAVPFVISQVSFHDWGGTALSLGGETYGNIRDCKFHRCAQCIAINGQGEISVESTHFERMENAAFSPGTGNGSAWIYVRNTVTRWTNCVFVAAEDYRTMILFDECSGCFFTGTKIEGSSRTTLSYDIIRINNTSIAGQSFVFTGNAFTMSSATGTFAGRFVTTSGTTPMGILVFAHCSATYGSGVASSIPLIDVTTNKPDHISVTGIYREAADNAVIKFANGATASTGSIYGTLAGLQGENIRFVTVSSGPFKIAAGQTNANLPFWVNGRLYRYLNSVIQILPISMAITTDASPGDAISIKYSLDTGNADLLTLGAAQFENQLWFPIRSSYIVAPAPGSPQVASILYTSGASASTATNYYFTFTYALIEDASTSNAQKFFVDAG